MGVRQSQHHGLPSSLLSASRPALASVLPCQWPHVRVVTWIPPPVCPNISTSPLPHKATSYFGKYGLGEDIYGAEAQAAPGSRKFGIHGILQVEEEAQASLNHWPYRLFTVHCEGWGMADVGTIKHGAQNKVLCCSGVSVILPTNFSSFDR